MRRYISLIVVSVLLAVTSCAPIPMYLNLESKNLPEVSIPIEGREIGVISVVEANGKDSALVAELGMGIAEKLESDVYVVSSEYMDLSEPGTLDLYAIQTQKDFLITVDSLYAGNYNVKRDNFITVKLPVSFKMKAYDARNIETYFDKLVVDTLSWTIFGSENVSDSYAVSQANSLLKEVMREVGNQAASVLVPTWSQEERMIVCFQSSDWETAYYLAYDFKWEQAMDIWLELVKSQNPQKSGSAAYNMAVACEILGRYDVALKWLEYAEQKCYFSQMTTLKRKLQSHLGI